MKVFGLLGFESSEFWYISIPLERFGRFDITRRVKISSFAAVKMNRDDVYEEMEPRIHQKG